MTDYKVILTMSRGSIGFEYWLRDGENTLVGMPGVSWPVPMAFYCNPQGVVTVGEEALRAVRSGTQNAFAGYFDNLAQHGNYTVAGETRPFRRMLLDAAEAVFYEFYDRILCGSRGSLADNRSNMPLTIVFEQDVEPYERANVIDLFRQNGYNRVAAVNYPDIIGKYVQEHYGTYPGCTHVLVASAEGGTLSLSLYRPSTGERVAHELRPSLGTDPRRNHVETLLWNRFVSQNPFLEREREHDAIAALATRFLNSSKPIMSGNAVLSDGDSYYWSLNRMDVVSLTGTGVAGLRKARERFLEDHGIDNPRTVVLLLRGGVAGNDYFIQSLSEGLLDTVRSDAGLRRRAMRHVLNLPVPQDDTPVYAPVFFGEPSKKTEPEAPVPEPAPAADVKSLRKQWRETKADAHGKIRAGKPAEAATALKAFLEALPAAPELAELASECRALLTEAETSVETPTDDVPRKDGRGRPRIERNVGDIHPNGKLVWTEYAPGKFDWRNITGSTIKHQKTDERAVIVDKLLADGRLAEAREICRTAGETERAKAISDVMKARKSVGRRKMEFELRPNPSKEQTQRVVDELRRYLALCDVAGITDDEIRKLLNQYKKFL